MQKFPLNKTSLHIQTHTRPNLEPYKIVSTPFAAPYHTRCTTLVQYAELYCCVWCKQYTQNKILQDYTIHNA